MLGAEVIDVRRSSWHPSCEELPHTKVWKQHIKPKLKITLESFSPLIVAVAANKADLAQKRGNMKTRWFYHWNKAARSDLLVKESDYLLLRSVQTETLYNLSSSKNITESLKNFGGGDSDTSFVVAAFGADLEVARGLIR